MTIRRSRSGEDGLDEPPALAPAIQSGNWGVVDGSDRICGVARKWTTSLGRLPCAAEWLADLNG